MQTLKEKVRRAQGHILSLAHNITEGMMDGDICMTLESINNDLGGAIKDTEPFFPRSGLNLSSTVKWTKPMTITTAVISRRLGRLPVEVTREIVKKLTTMLAN